MTTKAQLLKSLGITEAMANTLEEWGGQLIIRGRTNTLVALIRREMITPVQSGSEGREHYYTRKGVETVNAIRAHFGHKSLEESYSVIREFMAEDVLCAPETDGQPSVVVMGTDPSEWAPDVSSVPSECYYGCARPVTGAFTDYVGRTMGVCDMDRNRLDSETLVVPVDPAVWGGMGEDTPTVGIVQNTPGMSGRTHYHTPGCRDIAREMKRFGQRQSDVREAAFSSVASILEFEYGDIASDNAEVSTPEWWVEILANAQVDATDGNDMGVRIMPCLSIPLGNAGDSPLVMVHGEFRIGNLPAVAETMDARMSMVHRGAHVPSCVLDSSLNGAPVSMLAKELTCPECVSSLAPTIVTAPKVHAFESTGEAYSLSQCSDDIRDGDVLSIPSEGVVAILVKAWPVAVTEAHGALHSTDSGIQDCLSTQTESDGSDYSASLTLAESTIRVMQENSDDAGFDETMITKEYLLSVIVDEMTGVTVSLGWVTLTMNAAQVDDYARVAEEYGRTHGEGTPRHGWASIIRVHDVADV